ncbi:lipoprotein [Streptomyces roseoverticillatus]|uniref:Lipoprotein n=1 Tax=Streptomyces roseoverticillatus TaxID=66429 RepID=A0ABV3J1C7_9ACTN
MRKLTSGAVAAVVTIGTLAGCSSAAEKGSGAAGETPAPASAKAANESEKAKDKAGTGGAAGKAGKKAEWKDGGRIGGAGAVCEFPVSFEVAKAWQPKGLDAEGAAFLSKWLGHPSFKGACEIDAKPAGMIGYIRVWTAERTDMSPRQALETFVAEEKNVTGKEFSDAKAGDLPAAEVVYEQKSPLLDEPKPEQAFAVTTPKGVTIVHLGGLDSGEHKEMLPAYELAKKTTKLP